VRLPSPLYAILDRSVARGRDLPALLEAVLAGGGRLVQLREKTMPLAELFPLARKLARRCREAGALFVVNDRADLALAADAGGLHVGQDDLPALEARRLLRPGMILGVSTHDEAQARRAVADGADYVAVGSIFPTATKAGFQLGARSDPAGPVGGPGPSRRDRRHHRRQCAGGARGGRRRCRRHFRDLRGPRP